MGLPRRARGGFGRACSRFFFHGALRVSGFCSSTWRARCHTRLLQTTGRDENTIVRADEGSRMATADGRVESSSTTISSGDRIRAGPENAAAGPGGALAPDTGDGERTNSPLHSYSERQHDGVTRFRTRGTFA